MAVFCGRGNESGCKIGGGGGGGQNRLRIQETIACQGKCSM